MKINEIIKTKRLELQLTQEQVAISLGVSTPAVNKWEKGNSYPDITILPALARLLKTDLNTLCSFQADLSDEEVALFMNSLAQIKDAQIIYDQCMGKINTYPNCMALLYGCATMLEYARMQAAENSEIAKDIASVVESLYQRVYEGNDYKLKSHAAAMLIRKYIKREEYEKAEELIKEMPEQNGFDKKQLQIELAIAYEHLEEAQRISEERLLSNVNHLQQDLIHAMELALKQGRIEDGEYLADVAGKCAEVFDLWEYNRYVAKFEYYVKTKQKRHCIKFLLPMLKAIRKPWNINASPLYRSIKTKEMDANFQKEMQTQIVTSLQNDEEMDFIKEDIDIQSLQQELE